MTGEDLLPGRRARREGRHVAVLLATGHWKLFPCDDLCEC